jgi:antitoxin component YwqK of YwqJK toxin-antitoxin module
MEAAASFIKEIKEGTLLSFLPKDVLDMLPGFLLSRTYFNNGGIAHTYFLKARKFEGELLTYHLNGEIESKCYYENGKQEGESTLWSEHGTLESRCFYKHDKQYGPHTFYRTNGTVSYRTYQNNCTLF